jgi:alpha-1,6-mannosyltransferase
MKVCDLTQFYSPFSGGVKRYLEEKRHYAVSAGHEHILIVPGKRTETITEDKARTYFIESPMVSKTSRYRALLNLRAVENLLEKEQPDIIESSDPYQLAWKAIASGENLRIPVVGFYHSHFPEAYLRTTSKFLGKTATYIAMETARAYIRSLYNHFRRTFVSSAGLAQVLREWGVENVVLNELGVDTEIFHRGTDKLAARAELKIPSDRLLLLYVGRLASEKNVKTLFQAFENLYRQNPGHFHLLVVGDGPQRDSLHELQKATESVSWQRYCSDKCSLAKIYRAADLFVHPSVQETFGLVALESQASGTPIVGIRGSYMDRIILSDQTHWACDNSSEALTAAILEMSSVDLDAIGNKVAKQVAARYSWRKVFGQMFDVYQELRSR